jgi:ABC-2 type transport system permease protein
MKKLAAILWSFLLRAGRDRKALITSLVMPLVLTGILGAALGGVMSEQIDPVPTLLVMEDQGATLPDGTKLTLGSILAEQVLTAPEVTKLVKVDPSSDKAAAEAQVTSGKVSALIWVEPDFTRKALDGKAPQVHLLTAPGKATAKAVLESILGSFTDGVTEQLVAVRAMRAAGAAAGAQGSAAGAPGVAAGAQGSAASAPGVATGAPSMAAGATGATQALLPRLTVTASGLKSVGAMQYYAAAMSIMFLVQTAFWRAGDLIRERQAGTLQRQLISPTAPALLLMGQVLGAGILLALQFAILVVGTRLLFGVYWGPTGAVVALGGALALAATGMATGVAAFAKDPRVADSGAGLISTLFAALSGAMFPLYNFPAGLRAVARFTPNYWALQGFLDQMSGVAAGPFTQSVFVLCALGTVGILLGALGLSRRTRSLG